MTDKINFKKKINDSVQKGDELYYSNVASGTPTPPVSLGPITDRGDNWVKIAGGVPASHSFLIGMWDFEQNIDGWTLENGINDFTSSTGTCSNSSYNDNESACISRGGCSTYSIENSIAYNYNSSVFDKDNQLESGCVGFGECEDPTGNTTLAPIITVNPLFTYSDCTNLGYCDNPYINAYGVTESACLECSGFPCGVCTRDATGQPAIAPTYESNCAAWAITTAEPHTWTPYVWTPFVFHANTFTPHTFLRDPSVYWHVSQRMYLDSAQQKGKGSVKYSTGSQLVVNDSYTISVDYDVMASGGGLTFDPSGAYSTNQTLSGSGNYTISFTATTDTLNLDFYGESGDPTFAYIDNVSIVHSDPLTDTNLHFMFHKLEHAHANLPNGGYTNVSSLKGYFAEVEFSNSSTEKQELYTVGSEVTISSK
jgi:hypothetical protein